MATAQGEINSTQKKVDGMYAGYKTSKEYLAAQKLQGMTIQDIAKKYGFDFSRNYANRQAETAAQAQRNVYNGQGRQNDAAHKVGLQRIGNEYDSAAGSLDKGYFQKFLGTQQGQADRGLNAGIAASQNLQLAMNKQGEVADLWKQRSTNTQEEDLRYANQAQTIMEALAQVEKEKAANAENMYQGLLSKGYDILSSDRSSANQWADSAFSRLNSQIGTTMDFSKMRVADIYEQAQAARAAAAARASRGGGGGGGGYSGSAAKTSLTPSLNNYNNVLNKQKQTPLQKYYKPPVPFNQNYLAKEYGMYKPPVANNPNLTAWDRMKMLGL